MQKERSNGCESRRLSGGSGDRRMGRSSENGDFPHSQLPNEPEIVGVGPLAAKVVAQV
jgi:hypothetical protein